MMYGKQKLNQIKTKQQKMATKKSNMPNKVTKGGIFGLKKSLSKGNNPSPVVRRKSGGKKMC